jgi:GLPGLI family protein
MLLCLVVAATAQSKAEIEVSYTAISPNMRTGKLGDSTHQYVLLANAKDSKFYSPRTERIDSLCSTPEGEAKFNEMQRAAVLGGNYDDTPHRDGMMYVVKSTEPNIMKVYDTAGMEQYVVEEPVENIEWTLVEDSTKNVLGYDCIMATADYHGRKWTDRGNSRDCRDLSWRLMQTMAFIPLWQPAFKIPTVLLSRYIWPTGTRKQPVKTS